MVGLSFFYVKKFLEQASSSFLLLENKLVHMINIMYFHRMFLCLQLCALRYVCDAGIFSDSTS